MRSLSPFLSPENAIDDLKRIFRECPGGNLGQLIDAAIAALDDDDRSSVEEALRRLADTPVNRLLDRLQRQLEKKDERIEDLESKLEKAERWADCENIFRPRQDLSESELPVPRLQIELAIHSDYEHQWLYTLVYRHTLGELVGIPFGQTISKGGHRYDRYESREEMEAALPYRDGVHIRRDATSLNLPAYAIAPGYPPVLLSKLPAPKKRGEDE
jgi:hypothetical protein